MPREIKSPLTLSIILATRKKVFPALPPIPAIPCERVCTPCTKISAKQMKIGMAKRLTQERKRLGFLKRDFAYQTDISRETLHRYENVKRWIGVEFLAKAAYWGLDVNFVVTGQENTHA